MTDEPTTHPEGTEDHATWRATSASQRGSSHTGSSPNQDAVLVEHVDGEGDAGGGRLVAAVSDGHGGPRYVRSHIGARLAVRVARDALVQACEADDDATPPEQLLRGLVPDVVRRWREQVSAHLAANPLTDEEAARADDVAGRPYDAYGTTLLLALVSPQGVGLAQIGDGDALLRVNGFATRPMPSDDRLVAGMTTSLCLETAEHDFRFASVPGSVEVDLVLLATDGYGNSFASGDWWRTLVDDLAWFVQRHGFADLDEQLPSWLEESAQVGGDDVTVACVVLDPLAVPAADPAVAAASRSEKPASVPAVAAVATPVAAAHAAPSAALAGAPAAAAVGPGGTGPDEWPGRVPAVAPVAEEHTHGTRQVDEEPAGRPGRRTAVAVGAAALVAVLVGAGAWGLTRGGDPSTPTPTPTTPVSSPASPSTSSSSPPVKPGTGGGKKGGGQGPRGGSGNGGDKPQPDPIGPAPHGGGGDNAIG